MINPMEVNNINMEELSAQRSKLRRPRVHDEVLACLLKDIKSGIYETGEKLPSERHLMEQFGVGRPAVREALSALARMGLIEVTPGMRAKVCQLTLKPMLQEMRATLQVYSSTPEGWRQLLDTRQFFEMSAVRQLAKMVTEKQISSLEDILERQQESLDRSKIRDFALADIDFHRTLVECLENPFLSLLAQAFGDWLLTPMYASMQVRQQSELCFQAHSSILDAVKARNPDLAEQKMWEHLVEMRRFYQEDMMPEWTERDVEGLLPSAGLAEKS